MNKLIKFIVLFNVMFLPLFFLDSLVYAVPSGGILQQEKQPTGEKFKASIKGDEWFNYTATESGDLVVKDKDGYWYYEESDSKGLKKGDAKYKIDSKPLNAKSIKDVKSLREKKINDLKKSQVESSLMQSETRATSTSPINIIKTTGPQNLLVILVSFTDTTIQNSEAVWSNSFFGATGKTVKTYYDEVSVGKFDFKPAAETFGTVNNGVVSVTLNYQHPNTGDNTGAANRKIVADALKAADSNVDFSKYDTNGNGKIDYSELHLMTVIAGYEASYGYEEPSIWAHRWSLNSTESPVLDGKNVSYYPYGGYTQMGEIQSDHMATIGTACHELGHDIGLPDLYDTSDLQVSEGVGVYSLMGSGAWCAQSNENDGTSPAHLDAWSKTALGFATPIIASLGGYNIKSAANGYTVLKVPTTDPNQYFLVENRQLTGFDIGLGPNTKNNSGIVIWHIDENVIASNMSTNKVNADYTHKGVDLEEANEVIYGGSQLDDYNSKDLAYENYYKTGNNTTFNSKTVPNSKLYNGVNTDISISIPEVSSNAMMVYIDSSAVNVQHTVTFNSNGGTAVQNQRVTANELVSKPTMPTKIGYTFVSWYKEAGFINSWNFATDKVLVDTTLYAKWVANPMAPTLLKVAASSYNSIYISWGAVVGASGYEVYRSTSSTGSYVSIAATTTTSYNNIGLITNGVYYYKVKAYTMSGAVKAYSNYSIVVSEKPIPSIPTLLKAASSSYNSIYISWGAVTGASGYEVYRSTSSTGSYVSMAATTTTSYNNTGLTTNAFYYYKVKSYRLVGVVKVYSGFSAVVGAKPIPSIPASFKAARVSPTAIKLTWSVVSGASGYEIYRSTTSAGVYGLITTTTSLYYTNSGLISGKMYYYKIRAYRIVGSTKVYSN